MYTDKYGRERHTLAERYNFHKERYETGKVLDSNGEVHTLNKVARLLEGNKAAALLDKINKNSRRNFITNKYSNATVATNKKSNSSKSSSKK